MSKYGTAYIEGEAILAAQEHDEAYLQELVQTMTPTERMELKKAADYLYRFLQDDYRRNA